MMKRIPTDWREQAARAVDRGNLFDSYIPKFLINSPISKLGFWWGTAVGAVWGTLWSRGRIERKHGLLIFRGMPGWTFGRGGVCVGMCFLTGDDVPSDRVLKHEAVHAKQWRTYGALMPFLYAAAGRNPLKNRFEIEADLQDGNYVPDGM